MCLQPPDQARWRPPLWWRFVRLLACRRAAANLAALALDGYLAETGWLRSVREGAVVDRHGEPLPWATYPFVDFIAPRLNPAWRIFEYGAGASTLFYAARVAEVVAVEHDAAFAERLAGKLPPRARVLVRPLGSEEYAAAINEMTPSPDIVSVDGRDRVNCVSAALRSLADMGVLILDDAERAEYTPALSLLAGRGFRQLDFWGFSAGTIKRRCTSVFYRANNVLGL